MNKYEQISTNINQYQQISININQYRQISDINRYKQLSDYMLSYLYIKANGKHIKTHMR